MKPRTISALLYFQVMAIFLLALASSHSSFGQDSWSLVTPTPNLIYDLSWVQTSAGPRLLAGTNVGIVQKQDPSIDSWTDLNTGYSFGIRSVVAEDQFFMWALGIDRVFRTTNGGSTWTASIIPGSADLHSLIMVDYNVGWVVGDEGRIFKTTNGGVTWVAQTSNTPKILLDIFAYDDQYAIAVGLNGTVCRTSNGGITWTVSTVGNGTKNLTGIAAINSGLYAVGSGGWIIKSNDGGANWATLTSGTTTTLNDITHFNISGQPSGLYACGNNGILLKSLNGTTWTNVPSGRTDNFVTITAMPDGYAYAATMGKGFMRSSVSGNPCVAPVATITSPNISVCVGGNITINSNSTGTLGTRTWKKNGTAFNLATNVSAHGPVLTIPNAQLSDAGSYVLEVTSPCGTSTSTPITVSVNLPQQPSTIVGPGTASQNVATTYSVSPIAGATFSWNAGTGGTVTGTGSSVQLTWSTTGHKSVSVTATDACGTSIARNATVLVTTCAIPGQPSVISFSSGSECSGGSANYSVTHVAGVTYTWLVTTGSTVTGTGNNATVVWGAGTGTRTISVTPSNACGSGTARTLNVTVGTAPAQPSTITGSAAVCTGVSTPYSVTNVAGTTYTWSTGGGGTITGSGNSISVTWTSGGSKTLTVTPSNACGPGTVRTLSVAASTVPSQPGVIAGSTTVAIGSTNQFSVTNEAGVTYSWNAGAGGTVTGSGNNVNISWASAGSKTITLTPSTACGSGTARTLNVTVNDCAIPTQPSTIAGSTTACAGASGTYSVTLVGGVTYIWNAGTDGSVSGSGNSVTLSWTTTGSKTVTVTPSNACGNGTARTLTVTVSALPAQASVITGNTTSCKDAVVAYSVSNTAGVTYTWSTNGKGTVSGSGNSVNVTWTVPGANALTVTPSNSCGNGQPRSLGVTVSDLPEAPGSIVGNTTACTGTSLAYSVTNVPGVTYTWNGGDGSTVTGTGNAVTISWSNSGVKSVTATPSNACGNGLASTRIVQVSAAPAQPGSITGSVTANGGETQTYSVPNVAGVAYTWSTSADGVIAGSGNSVQVTWATAGVKTLTVTPANNCGSGVARTLGVTVTVPCTIPGTPSFIQFAGSPNLIPFDVKRFTVGFSSGATSMDISVMPNTGIAISAVSGNQWDITFSTPGNYVVSGVGIIAGCGAGTPVTTNITVCNTSVADPVGLSGPTTGICRNSTTRYSVTPVEGIIYDWGLSGGLASGTFTYLNAEKSIVDITWNTIASVNDVVYVKARNGCNVLSDNVYLDVTFVPGFGFINITTNVIQPACIGNPVTFTISNPEVGVAYTWDLQGPGTLSGDNLSATIALSPGRVVKVYGTNACETNKYLGSEGVTPFPYVVQPTPVLGPATVDYNVDATYTVDAQPDGVFFGWSVDGDATVTPGPTMNTKNIQWATGGTKNIVVTATNNCATSPDRTFTVFVNGPCVAPIVPGAIDGSGAVCAGLEYQYAVPYQGFDTFNWSAGADATITGSGHIRTIKWSTGGSKTISVTATNPCTTSAAQTLAVTVNSIPAQPATLTGSTSGCNGSTQQFALATPVAGVTYLWEVQGGTFATSGAQGQIADVTWTSLGVNQIKLKPSNNCGNGTPRIIDVTVGTAPSQPSLISGDGEVCVAISKTYSITSVAGVTYAWNAGSGGTVTGTGNSVSISWSTAGAKTITVTPSNACGNGTARTLSLNVNGVPSQPSVISGVASSMLGATESYSVTNIAGVDYVWSVTAGGALAYSGNAAEVYWETSGSKTISVVPSSACGNGTARTLAVTVSKIPQTISFSLGSPVSVTDIPLLAGESSSGLLLSYTSSNTAVAEVNGNSLILKSAGTTTITATQAGDATYAAATDVGVPITVNKAGQTISFSSLTDRSFGEAFDLEAEASSGLPVSYVSSNTSVATVNSSGAVTTTGVGSTDITATQGGNTNYLAASPVVHTLVVNKADQTIAFESLAVKGIGASPFSLEASASSELPVSYSSSNTGVATVSGDLVTVVGEGTTTITASQAGNSNYNAASPVQQVLTVNGKDDQSITFEAITPRTFGDGSFELVASSTSSMPLAFNSSNTLVAIVSGSTVTIVGAGSSVITASQEGNTQFNPAPVVDQLLLVAKADQTITFGPLAAKDIAAAPFSLEAISSSGLTVSYSSSNTAVATVSSNTVTVVGSGTTTITANQGGNGNYNVAVPVEQTLTVNAKESQSITFTALEAKTFGDASFVLTAISTSALPVVYTSSNTLVATVSGSTVTIVGAGTTVITASQTGNIQFNAALDVDQTLVVNKAGQTISFGPLADRSVGDAPFSLTGTATSGLPVSYSSSNTTVATVSGNAVTVVGPGTTTIAASQAGNGNFNTATSVEQTLTVINKENQSITFEPLDARTFGDASFTLVATSTSALPVVYTSSNTLVATVSGNTVTIVGAGSTVITASQVGNNQFNPASDVVQTLVVNKADQTINFVALAQRGISEVSFNLGATASSGLPLSYVSSDNDVATIAGNVVTMLTDGTVSITASQAGDNNYNAATSVTQSLVIINDILTRIIGVSGVLEFGDVIIPETASKTFTVSNTGNDVLNISSITYPSGYSGDKSSGSIVAGGTMTVTVTFSPTLAEDYLGEIVLNSNSTSGTGSVGVSGTGLIITSIDDIVGVKQMKVFPNPGRGVFTVNVRKPLSTQAVVVDGLGREAVYVDLQPIGADLYQIDITQVSSGVYFLKLPGDQLVKMVRIIKID